MNRTFNIRINNYHSWNVYTNDKWSAYFMVVCYCTVGNVVINGTFISLQLHVLCYNLCSVNLIIKKNTLSRENLNGIIKFHVMFFSSFAQSGQSSLTSLFNKEFLSTEPPFTGICMFKLINFALRLIKVYNMMNRSSGSSGSLWVERKKMHYDMCKDHINLCFSRRYYIL